MKTKIEKISATKIQSYCKNFNDLSAYGKMAAHELSKEPTHHIIVISKKDNKKIPRKKLEKILKNLGFKTNIFLSKKHYSDGNAAMNINISRLHIRFFEGKNRWYIIAHIDKTRPLHFNIIKVIKSHLRSGLGDYKTGTTKFYKILTSYFQSAKV